MTQARDVVALRGPFADGPPPEALLVEAPPLEHLRIRDAWRFAVVLWVTLVSVLRSLFRRLFRRNRDTWPRALCDGLIDAFIRLGPTAIKGGQIIASSGALFPVVLAESARRCLDAVPAFPAEHVREAIEGDLGLPIETLFTHFDSVPLSAASIGQVHACVLKDGRDAVVKVQRPGIRKQMAMDLRIGFRLAWIIEKSPWGRQTNARELVRDLHGITFQELNPALEAWQQHRFREKIWAFGDNEGVTAPEVFWDYCGPRVICMERVYGIPMDHFEEMADRGIDGQAILRQGAKVWAESVMVHGPFHGDMHAGNMWVLEDGRGCYLDFGIMGELPDDWKQLVKDLFYTCSFDLDFVRVARAYRRVGAIPADMGSDEELGGFLHDLLGPILEDGYGSLDIAQLVTQSLEMLKSYQSLAPKELVLVAKQLLYVDKYTRFLAPDYSLTSDPFIVKNIFPVEAAEKAAELGMSLDRPSAVRARPKREEPSEPAEKAPAHTSDGGAMRHVFLSDAWITEVRVIGEEYRQHAQNANAPSVTMNLVVTEVPFGPGSLNAHVSNTEGVVDVELGHLEGVDLVVTVDYDTARAIVVDQDASAAMRAFMLGKIRLEGDLAKVLGESSDPFELMKSLDFGGASTLSDVDPMAAEFAERLRAITT